LCDNWFNIALKHSRTFPSPFFSGFLKRTGPEPLLPAHIPFTIAPSNSRPHPPLTITPSCPNLNAPYFLRYVRQPGPWVSFFLPPPPSPINKSHPENPGPFRFSSRIPAYNSSPLSWPRRSDDPLRRRASYFPVVVFILRSGPSRNPFKFPPGRESRADARFSTPLTLGAERILHNYFSPYSSPQPI